MRGCLRVTADEHGEVVLLLKCGMRNAECGIKRRDALLGAIMKLLKLARISPKQLGRIDLDVARASFSFSRAAWAVAKTFALIYNTKVGQSAPKYYGKPTITLKHAKHS